MKKLFSFLTLLLAFLLLLTACGAEGRRGETAPAARHTAAPAPQTQTSAPETPEPDIPVVTPESIPAPSPAAVVVEVRTTRQDGGEGERVLFEGLDAAGNVVWQHTATTEYRTELTLIEEIGAWEDRYYFNREGVVSCLRLADGFLLWENGEFGGASISCQIDQRNGNVYLCGWYGPDFFACGKDGETLSRFPTAADEFYWPSDMSWYDQDTLVIYYNGGAGAEISLPYYVDLRDFTISWDFGYEDIDADTQYWANIFISDFIEQYKSNYPEDGGSDYELASFAHMFCRLNRRDAISYDGNFDTFSLDTVNEICRRFFGREIHPADGVLYTNPWGMEWTFENGTFRFPMGDGESYNRFAVVSDYLRLPGGDVILSYEVYELDLEEYWTTGMDGKLYHMSYAQSRAMAETGRIRRLGYGFAEVLPIDQGGHDGYYMIHMNTYLDA